MKLVRYEYPQVPSTSAFNRLFDPGMPSLARFGEFLDDFWAPEAGYVTLQLTCMRMIKISLPALNYRG